MMKNSLSAPPTGFPEAAFMDADAPRGPTQTKPEARPALPRGPAGGWEPHDAPTESRKPTPPPPQGLSFKSVLLLVIVAVVLSVAASAGVTYAMLSSNLAKVKEEYDNKLTLEIKSVQAKAQDALDAKAAEWAKSLVTSEQALKKDLASGQEEHAKHKQFEKTTGQALKTLSTDLVTFRNDFAESMEQIQKLQGEDVTLDKRIKENSGRIDALQESLSRLTSLEADVAELKNDTGGLKQQYRELKGDIVAVKARGQVTETEVLDLRERSRVFQLRVMAEKARLAAENAEKGDLETLLQGLGD
jgi:phage shock protein A